MNEKFDLNSQEGLRERYNELTERYVEKSLREADAILDKAYKEKAEAAGISIEEVKLMQGIREALESGEPLDSYVDDPKGLNESAESRYLERIQASRSTDSKQISFGKTVEKRCAETKLKKAIEDCNPIAIKNAADRLAKVTAKEAAKDLAKKAEQDAKKDAKKDAEKNKKG